MKMDWSDSRFRSISVEHSREIMVYKVRWQTSASQGPNVVSGIYVDFIIEITGFVLTTLRS